MMAEFPKRPSASKRSTKKGLNQLSELSRRNLQKERHCSLNPR